MFRCETNSYMLKAKAFLFRKLSVRLGEGAGRESSPLNSIKYPSVPQNQTCSLFISCQRSFKKGLSVAAKMTLQHFTVCACVWITHRRIFQKSCVTVYTERQLTLVMHRNDFLSLPDTYLNALGSPSTWALFLKRVYCWRLYCTFPRNYKSAAC